MNGWGGPDARRIAEPGTMEGRSDDQQGGKVARKPNYSSERNKREKAKAAKREAKRAAKLAAKEKRQKDGDGTADGSSASASDERPESA